MELTVEEKKEAISMWQGLEGFDSHKKPLKCICSSILVPYELDGDVFLSCPNCVYLEVVPERVYLNYRSTSRINGEFYTYIFGTLDENNGLENFVENAIDFMCLIFYRILGKISYFYIKIKYFLQRVFRGYSDDEIYDLSYFILDYVYPRFKEFVKSERHGYPLGFSKEEWEETLHLIERAFDLKKAEIDGELDFENAHELEEYYEEMFKGFKLFGEYFMYFWD